MFAFFGPVIYAIGIVIDVESAELTHSSAMRKRFASRRAKPAATPACMPGEIASEA